MGSHAKNLNVILQLVLFRHSEEPHRYQPGRNGGRKMSQQGSPIPCKQNGPGWNFFIKSYLNIGFRSLRMLDNYCFRQLVATDGSIQGITCSIGWHMESRLEEKLKGRSFQIHSSWGCTSKRRWGQNHLMAVAIREEKKVQFNRYLGGKIIHMQ